MAVFTTLKALMVHIIVIIIVVEQACARVQAGINIDSLSVRDCRVPQRHVPNFGSCHPTFNSPNKSDKSDITDECQWSG